VKKITFPDRKSPGFAVFYWILRTGRARHQEMLSSSTRDGLPIEAVQQGPWVRRETPASDSGARPAWALPSLGKHSAIRHDRAMRRLYHLLISQLANFRLAGPIVRAPMNIASSVPPCVIAVAARHLLTAHFNGWKNKTAQVAIEEEKLTREIPDPNCLARSCHFA
jgi:hypothetical protein